MSYSFKSVGQGLYPISVAHPHVMPRPLFPKSGKNGRSIIHNDLGLPVFPFGGPDHLTPQDMGHQLHSITYSKDWDTQIQDLVLNYGGIIVMDTRRTAGQYDSTGMECLYIFQAHIEGVNLTIDLTHPDPPGNQLSVLRAEVQYEDLLMMDVPHSVHLSVGK